MEKKLLWSQHLFDWAIPLFLLAIMAPFSSAIDLNLSGYFFDKETLTFSNHPVFTFLYTWGLLPGQLLWFASLIVFICSFFVARLKALRKPALVIALTIAIGAGAITTLFKEEWKRPRPKQIEQFGGTEAFKPFYEPNFFAKGQLKSFPSGHTAMGFCFLALAVLGRRLNYRPLYISGMALAIGLGCLLAMARIAQGGHFLTDTLASACLMWITASAADRIVYRNSCRQIV